MWSYCSGLSLRQSRRSCSSTLGNFELYSHFALTTTTPVGLFSPRRNTSTASVLRRGFQLNQSYEPSVRIVGFSNSSDLPESVCASSTHALPKPSKDLMLSAL